MESINNIEHLKLTSSHSTGDLSQSDFPDGTYSKEEALEKLAFVENKLRRFRRRKSTVEKLGLLTELKEKVESGPEQTHVPIDHFSYQQPQCMPKPFFRRENSFCKKDVKRQLRTALDLINSVESEVDGSNDADADVSYADTVEADLTLDTMLSNDSSEQDSPIRVTKKNDVSEFFNDTGTFRAHRRPSSAPVVIPPDAIKPDITPRSALRKTRRLLDTDETQETSSLGDISPRSSINTRPTVRFVDVEPTLEDKLARAYALLESAKEMKDKY
jgi:hypothetical protein